MQWLIDLVIETIGVPPCYIDRGDPVNEDFTAAQLIDDGAWHELDLSGIVPAKAQAVHLILVFVNAAISKLVTLRKAGNVRVRNISVLYTYIAGVPTYHTTFVAVDADRKIEYNIDAGGWILKGMTVRGWIL